MNAWLPDGVRTGLVPVELLARGERLCPPVFARIIPAGPLVPRIVSVTDGVNLIEQNRSSSGLLKIQLEEIASPDSVSAMIDDQAVANLAILRTDPRTPRYEVNLELPKGLAPGPHKLRVRIGGHRVIPAEVVVSS